MNKITLLTKEDQKVYDTLLEECSNSWNKQQIFRTETEMRLSVLNDAKHPTPAAKYWQAVREQSAFFQNAVQLHFQYKRAIVEQKQLEEELKQEKDDLKRELLQIDIEEKEWGLKSMKLEAHHRIRELEHWSRIKKELDDGSFDTTNPNTHQFESLPKRFENQAKSLTPGSSASEVINIMGLHHTAQKHAKQLEEAK